MNEIVSINEMIPVADLKKLAANQFEDMIKAVVDVQKEIIAVGGSLHADEEKILLQSGSSQFNLWGINIYFEVDAGDRIEFDSMINIRPVQGNKSRDVENIETREKIISIVTRLIQF